MLAAAALVLVLASTPASGVSVDAQGSGVAVRPEGAAPFVVTAESRVTAEGAGPPLRFRAKELVADYTPDGPTAALQDWYGRQARLRSLARHGPVRLVFVAADGPRVVTPHPRRRGLGDLTADVWLLLMQGIVVGLLGAWLVVLKPYDAAARVYATACLGIVMTGFSGALYDGRDLLDGGWWLWPVQAVNLAGTALCSASLLTLYLLLPRRIAGPGPVRLAAAAAVGFAGVVASGLAPLAVWYLGLLATAPALMVVMLVQWRLARGRPKDRAVLHYLGAVTISGMGLLSAFMAAPVLLGVPSLLGDGTAAGPVILVFAGTALGVRRRRLFELETWAHRIMGGVAWTVGVLLCDAALIWGLSLSLPAAPATSLAVAATVGLAYLPFRSHLRDRAAGRSRTSDIELFQAATTILFTRDDGERSRRWRDLLSLTFAPLETRPGPDRLEEPRLSDDGVALHLPATLASPALTLAHRSHGRKLFSQADLALARELTRFVRRVEAARTEYVRGVTEERIRIAQDLHDDINSRLLTSLHRSDLTQVRADVRQALADIRTMIGGLAGQDAPAHRILADLRFETAERLAAAGVALAWDPLPSETDALLDHAGLRALVAGVREAITNVVKHSHAGSVRVDTELAPARLRLRLADDGVGLAGPVERTGGLCNLQDRARKAGGDVEISGSAAGVVVSISLPLKRRPAG